MPKILITKAGKRFVLPAATKGKKPCDCHEDDDNHKHTDEECEDCKEKRLAREARVVQKATFMSSVPAPAKNSKKSKVQKPCGGCAERKRKNAALKAAKSQK